MTVSRCSFIQNELLYCIMLIFYIIMISYNMLSPNILFFIVALYSINLVRYFIALRYLDLDWN